MLTTEALFRSIYTLVDDAMNLHPHRRPGPDPLIPDSQLVTMYLLQAMKGVLSDSHWLRLMETEYRFFTHLPERSRYQRRRRVLAGWVELFLQTLVPLLWPKDSRKRGIDSCPITVAFPRRVIGREQERDGLAKGSCASLRARSARAFRSVAASTHFKIAAYLTAAAINTQLGRPLLSMRSLMGAALFQR
jgi:hypothetical protein